MKRRILLNALSFGKRRTVTKFPKVLGKFLVKSVSKLSSHSGGDAEAREKSALILTQLVGAERGALKDTVTSLVADIVEPLFLEENPKLQEQTAKTVALLAAQLPPEICLGLLEFPGVLDGLVRLLFKAERCNVQEGAALALINLADGEQCRRMIAQYPNAMLGVVGLLSQDRIAQILQIGATLVFTLGLLPENQIMIVEFPGALEGLVRVLLKNEIPHLQACAALALSALAASPDTKRTIADFPQALVGILQLLNQEGLPEVQECAVGAIANLITEETTPRILEFPSVLARLALLALTCEAALVAIINLDLYRRKQLVKEIPEQALARCRRLPEFRLLNYPTSA